MKQLEYELEAYGGETIEEYVDRLLDFYREVLRNKLATYASFINQKRSIVIGNFNGVKITIDHNSKKEDIVKELKTKLNIK